MAVSPRHHGFALLWTLALLALAAVVLCEMSRRSAHLAAQAVREQEALERKWAMASCRNTLLWNVDSLLLKAEPKKNSPVRALAFSQSLGDVQLEIIAADEQAKVNVNTLYGDIGRDRSAQLLKRLAGPDAVLALRPDPRAKAGKDKADEPSESKAAAHLPQRSARGPTTSKAGVRPFGCWSQVLDSDRPEVCFASHSPLNEMTLWGDGKLNLRRASEQAMRSALGQYLTSGQIAAVLQARQRRPKESVAQWLDGSQINKDDAAKIAQRVTDESQCHSLLIVAHSGGREWYEQVILDRGVAADVRIPTTAPATAPSEATTAPTTPAAAHDSAGGQGQPTIYRMTW